MRRHVLVSTLAVLVTLGFQSCGEGESEHEHGGGGTAAVPEHYSAAVEECARLSRQIDEHIAEGHLDDVHPIAADIQKIAEKLPALAQDDLPADLLREVNIKAKELAGMFAEIDEAADAGKKEETVAIHNRMKALIADLQQHASEAEEEHHDEH